MSLFTISLVGAKTPYLRALPLVPTLFRVKRSLRDDRARSRRRSRANSPSARRRRRATTTTRDDDAPVIMFLT